MKIKRKSFIGIWGFIIALSIIARCNPTLLFRTRVNEYLLLVGSTILAISTCIKSIPTQRVLICDICFAATPCFFITNDEVTKYIIITIICLLFYYMIQNNYIQIKYIEYPLIIFAIFTSIITWISFFAPAFYVSNILSLFPEGSSLTYSFLNRNMYHGFTNHYSRNSFYIIIGILLLFSSILAEKKKSIAKKILIFFLLCTEFLVAKRGPTLFLVITMMLIVIEKECSFEKKLKKSVKFIFLGIVFFVLAYLFVPGVENIVNRLFSPNSSADISSSRFYLWGIAIKLFMRKPLFGNGWGSYLEAMSGTTFQGAHNDYFQFLAEIGVFGFLINIVANFTCLYYSRKTFDFFKGKNYSDTLEQKWSIFSLSLQIFILLYSLTGMPHYAYDQYGLYLMLCGYSIGLYKHRVNYIKKGRG